MLEWTGERFLPWIKESAIAYEHLHRYAYAATLVQDKSVLDLACGEGYGSKMLAEAASSVVGIDLDESTVRHATAKYAGPNLQFLAGSITAVPLLKDLSLDVIVCFEAIEHIQDQDSLLGEVKRLLKPDGLFIVSTPNKVMYHDETNEENPFHVKELYFEEFQQLLARHFQSVRFLGQRIHPGSTIWPLSNTGSNGFREFVIERGESDFHFLGNDQRVPLYFIALASDSMALLPQPGSVLIDHSDGLIKEKDQKEQELRETKAAFDEAEQWQQQQVLDREKTIASLEEALKWRQEQTADLGNQVEELNRSLEWTEVRATELQKAVFSQETALAWRASQVSELEKITSILEEKRSILEEKQSILEEKRSALEAQNSILETKNATLEGNNSILQANNSILEAQNSILQSDNASLRADLQDTRHRLSRTSSGLAEANWQLEALYNSSGWKFILRIRRLRESLTPPGSLRRKAFEKLMGLVRSRL